MHRSVACDCPDDERKKKPQLLKQQSDDVAGTAQHFVERITERTFERISPKSVASLQMTDCWLDFPAPLNHRVQCSSDPAFLFRLQVSNALKV